MAVTPPVATTNLPQPTAFDEVLGNQTADGILRTGRLPFSRFATQMAAQAPFSQLLGASAGGMKGYPTEALLAAVTAPEAGTLAIVYADPDPQQNGTWRKTGTAGQGGWEILPMLAERFIVLHNAGAGTGDAIQLTSGFALPDETYGATFQTRVRATNTGAVTIAVNGAAPRPLLTAAGNPLEANYLKLDMPLQFVDGGSDYRMTSTINDAAIQAAAEAALAAQRQLYIGSYANDAAADAAFTSLGGTKVVGSSYYNESVDAVRYWDGATWQTVPYAAPADGSVTSAKIGAEAVTDAKLGADVRLIRLANALRTALASGPGPALDGKALVDLCNSTALTDTANCSDYRFVANGLAPAVAPANPLTAAYGLTSGNSTGWSGHTIGTVIGAAEIDDTSEGRSHVRLTFRAGTGGPLELHGVFIGVHTNPTSGAPGFDPAFPLTEVTFGGSASVTISAGATAVSDTVPFTIPVGKALVVGYYIKSGGYIATKTQSDWTSYYKAATNEPAAFIKGGYTVVGSGVAALERIETLDDQHADMSVQSKSLTLSATPASCDLVALCEGASADLSDLTLEVSRDGATWQDAAPTVLHSADDLHLIGAANVSLASAGSGAALRWRGQTANNKALTLHGVALQAAATFLASPALIMRRRLPVTTHQFEATVLGRDVTGGVDYGRFGQMTQDWEIEGPTEFDIKCWANLEHLGALFDGDPASNDIPVAWSVAVTATWAESLAALGPKDVSLVDTTPATGNNQRNWIGFDTGNIANRDEHYKTAFPPCELIERRPGAVRFEVWGHSATGVDSPLRGGRIVLNHPEVYGVAHAGFIYNGLRIGARPAR